jgi:membrane associated rhomboid family serine protease
VTARVAPRRPVAPSSRVGLPLLTLTVLLATSLGAAAQLMDSGVLDALRRDPAALAAGEWWRLFTPLLVLDGDPLIHYATDTVVLIVVGAVLERRAGSLRWAAMFAAGALVGQLAGYAWDPSGAGASIGICGLIGGLAVEQLAERRVSLVASLFSVGLVGALTSLEVMTGLTSDRAIASVGIVVTCAALVNVVMLLHRRADNPMPVAVFVAAAVIGGALVLVAWHDNHGAALLAGVVVGACIFVGQSVLAGRSTANAPS